MSSLQENPFFVKTPEAMSAQEVVDLFVPFSDDLSIQDPGHVFIHGHRGCGKSMMFRYLSPDCQSLVQGKPVSDLPYFGVYLSVKATDLNIGELNRLQHQISGHILNEHFLVIYLTVKTLQSIERDLVPSIRDISHISQLRSYCQDVILDRLKMAGWSDVPDITNFDDASSILRSVIKVLDTIHARSSQYVKQLLYTQEMVPFDGVLLGFQDLLLPVARRLKELSFAPKGPIFLFIDDADNLSYQQTQVLNTWVSYRNTAELSLKIATQLSYKTYSTVNLQRIEAAHDYAEVRISNIYTGPSKSHYPGWVEEVVNKRLKLAGIESTARDFFPEEPEQVAKIEKIAEEIKKNWRPGEGGYRPRDDAYRYARPDYIKSLGGASKHSYSYVYSGFEQLVHISSGIIRYFLDPAAKMYGLAKEEKTAKRRAKKKGDVDTITYIPPRTQDHVLRAEADELMHHEFDKLVEEIENGPDYFPEGTLLKLKKLRNLLTVLGAVFYQFLIDDKRSTRRYFSFIISSEPDSEILKVVRLGIQYGFLYESFVGSSDGRGRTPLYVLTRRLAPYFKLDPVGFFLISRFQTTFF
jgi:hypothetical protein